MFKLLLFFFALVVTSQASCDADKFLTCQTKFSEALGIDSSYNWIDPQGLSQQIENIYANGTKANPLEKGIVGVCNAYNVFLQCLSDDSFTAQECFDPIFLIKNDQKPNEAYNYAFLMSMIQYQCGAGFYLAIDNWTCLQQVYKGKSNIMNKCTTTFTNAVKTDPKNACTYVQNGMNCFSQTVRGCADELHYYACESFKQYTIPKYDYCSADCSV